MNENKKISKWFRLAILILFAASLILPGLPAAGNETESDRTLPSVDRPIDETLQQPDGKIDRVGKEVGNGVDRLSAMAAGRLGPWVNKKVFSGISWLKLLLCLVMLMTVVVFERMMRWFINRKIKRMPKGDGGIQWTKLFLDAAVIPLSLLIWVYGIFGAFSPLFPHFLSPDGSNAVYSVFRKGADLGRLVALFWFIYLFVNLIDARLTKWARASESTIDDILVPLVGKTLRFFIVILAGIIVIQNLTGIKIGPLLASLGIGGVAVALAAKDSIANFFGTLTVLFDKPFQVGERIIIDNYDGVVEHVGFRSTRIRLLSGHLVTIPNEKVVNSGLENIGKRPFIRWLTNIGITYDTPPDKIEKAVDIISTILENHEGFNPDFPPRVYFNGFNDWSLNIMAIAWYHPANYWDFQAWVQRTCLEITRRFRENDIDFAFPTKTVHLANDAKRQLKVGLLPGEDGPKAPEYR